MLQRRLRPAARVRSSVHGGRAGRARSRRDRARRWPPSPASSRSTTCTCGRSPRVSRRCRRTSWSGPATTATSRRRRLAAACSTNASASTTRRSRSTTRRRTAAAADRGAAPDQGVPDCGLAARRLGRMKVVKPGEDHDVPRGVVGGAEISQTTAGAQNIYMAVFRVPPGAQSHAPLPRGVRERRVHAVRAACASSGATGSSRS